MKIDYFALTSPPAHTAAAQSDVLSVHVGPVSIPDGVDKPQILAATLTACGFQRASRVPPLAGSASR